MVQITKTQESLIIKAKERSIAYQGKMMKALSWLPAFEWRSNDELVYQKGTEISLVHWLKNEKKEAEVLEIIDAYIKIQREMEAHLMDEDKLVCDPEWIFWEPKSKVLRLVYIPWDFQTGVTGSFIKRFAKLLWIEAVNQKWQNERLILMLYRMQVALKQNQNQPQMWGQWVEQEKRRVKERDAVKEQALDILTEEDTVVSERTWLRRLIDKFPIAIR